MRHKVQIALLGAAMLAFSAAGPASAHAAAEEREVIFVANGDNSALVPTDAAEPQESVAGDGHVVTLSLDATDLIVKREIELVRAESLQITDDQPATYSADTSGNVSLEWFDPSHGEIDWTITRDGVVIDRVNGNAYTDKRGADGGTTEYRVEGSRTVVVDGRKYEQPFTTVLSVPRVDDAALGSHLDAQVLSPAENTDIIEARSSTVTTVRQQLNTFIPDYAINGPFNLPACLQAWNQQPGTVLRFAGDNRSFASGSVESPSVRTGINAQYVFSDNGQDPFVSFGVRTSGTRLIDANGNTVKQRYANLDRVRRIGDAGDPWTRLSTWNHEARDPLCALSDPIDYELEFGGSRDNWATLRGWHEQAPSYEFRNKWTRGSQVSRWYNVYTHKNKGFEYLFSVAPSAHVDLYIKVPTSP